MKIPGSAWMADLFISIHKYMDTGLIRRIALHVLAHTKEDETLDFLIESLKHEDGKVRCAAVSSFGKILRESSIDHLLPILKFDHDERVRKTVIRVFRTLKCKRVWHLLTEALEDEDPRVRKNIVEALEKVADEEEVLEFLEAKLKDERMIVRESIIEVLRRIGGTKSVDVLVRAYEDPIPEVRKKVVVALKDILIDSGNFIAAVAPTEKENKALNLLKQASLDTDERVRDTAHKALQEVECVWWMKLASTV